jgi:hypothetical protein
MAIMEDAEEAAVATTDVVDAEAASMHAVEEAEAAMTATLSHARFVASQAMKPGSVGTATPMTKNKKRRKKRVPM